MRRKRAFEPPPIPEERDLPKRMISRSELALRVRNVELLMNRGAGDLRIIQYCRDNWKRGRKYALKLMERVRQRWIKDMERDRPAWKAMQIRRLEELLATLWQVDDATRNYSQILQTEKLMADITGTKEPLKVDLGSSQLEAVGKIMATLSADQFAAALEQHAEEKELAQKARVVLRLGDGMTVEQKAPETVEAERLRKRTK